MEAQLQELLKMNNLIFPAFSPHLITLFVFWRYELLSKNKCFKSQYIQPCFKARK